VLEKRAQLEFAEPCRNSAACSSSRRVFHIPRIALSFATTDYTFRSADRRNTGYLLFVQPQDDTDGAALLVSQDGPAPHVGADGVNDYSPGRPSQGGRFELRADVLRYPHGEASILAHLLAGQMPVGWRPRRSTNSSVRAVDSTSSSAGGSIDSGATSGT
jgi:hypothetical protein